MFFVKNYKLVDKTPYHSAGFGAMTGAAVSATSPASALAGMAVGAGVGLVGGGVKAYKDAKARRHPVTSDTQFQNHGEK